MMHSHSKTGYAECFKREMPQILWAPMVDFALKSGRLARFVCIFKYAV